MTEQDYQSISPARVASPSRKRKHSQTTTNGVTFAPPPLASLNGLGATADRPLRLYMDGIFDMFHFGHALALKQAKDMYPHVHLIVGVCSDELTHKLKGRTVMNSYERYESVRNCKWVDEVVEDAPWLVDDAFLAKHRIQFVCHDEMPYGSAGSDDVYAPLKAQGKFIATQRTGGISTSDLITRIIRDYDEFVRRNLKRGISREDMNIPFLREKRIRIQGSVQRIEDKIDAGVGKIKTRIIEKQKEFVRDVQDTKEEIITKMEGWLDNSRDLVGDFLGLFGIGETGVPLHKRLKRTTERWNDKFRELAEKSPM